VTGGNAAQEEDKEWSEIVSKANVTVSMVPSNKEVGDVSSLKKSKNDMNQP
jgi:hypothetical protein